MKIKAIVLICCLLLTFAFSACAKDSGDTATDPQDISTDASYTGEQTSDEATDSTPQELTAPAIEWWEVYNPNGFDTFTAEITNPNSVTIDFSYDIVFYKDGAEVSRIEYCDTFSILPGHKDLIWVNADVPAADKVDDVKLENVYVTETAYPAIDGKYEFTGVEDGDACFNFEFDSKPTLATVWFLLYNDTNANGQFDKGEIVVVDTDSLMEQTGKVSFNTNVYSYTDYEVFFTAY